MKWWAVNNFFFYLLYFFDLFFNDKFFDFCFLIFWLFYSIIFWLIILQKWIFWRLYYIFIYFWLPTIWELWRFVVKWIIFESVLKIIIFVSSEKKTFFYDFLSTFYFWIFDIFHPFAPGYIKSIEEIEATLKSYHSRMYQLESDKFELEYEVARKDYEARIKMLFSRFCSRNAIYSRIFLF